MDQQSTDAPSPETSKPDILFKFGQTARKLNPWMISTFVLAILLLFAARAIFFVPQGYPISNPPTQTPTPTPGTITSPDNATTFTGTIDCLPHRDTSGGQTLECTIGLKTEEGDYYRLQDLNDQDMISGKISIGETVTITGSLLWLKMPDQKYDTKGTIEVVSIDTN